MAKKSIKRIGTIGRPGVKSGSETGGGGAGVWAVGVGGGGGGGTGTADILEA